MSSKMLGAAQGSQSSLRSTLGATVLVVAWTFGCSGSSSDGGSPGDALFQSPGSNTTATADDLYGLWGGSATDNGFSFDIRFEIAESQLTLANRCHYPSDATELTASATVAVRITADTISVLESKSDTAQDGDHKCFVTASPQDLHYTLAGTKLTVTASDGKPMELTKIRD